MILQWREKSVDVDAIDDASHKALVGGAGVVCNDLTEFAKLVAERAQRLYEVGRPAAGEGKSWFALIKADKPDSAVADEVSQILTSANVSSRVTHTGKPMMDWLRDKEFGASHIDALLIIYGSCSDAWLEQLGDELMAVDLNLKDMAPVRAYYVCTEDARLPYRSKGVLQVRHRDKEGWQRLMAAIQERGGEP